jgi:hypothetical protein
MSKKNLKSRLNEGTIRRFMGLSGIGALGENFIDRLREEDDLPPEDDLGAEEAPVDDMGAEPPADDMGAEAPPAEGDVEAATEMAQDVADAVADALTTALGQHGVEVTSGEAGGAEAPVDDMGAEPPMDDLGAEPPADDLGGEPPEDEAPMDDLEEAGIDLVDDDRMVAEIARRVAQRLVRESNAKTPRPRRRSKVATRATRRRKR